MFRIIISLFIGVVTVGEFGPNFLSLLSGRSQVFIFPAPVIHLQLSPPSPCLQHSTSPATGPRPEWPPTPPTSLSATPWSPPRSASTSACTALTWHSRVSHSCRCCVQQQRLSLSLQCTCVIFSFSWKFCRVWEESIYKLFYICVCVCKKNFGYITESLQVSVYDSWLICVCVRVVLVCCITVSSLTHVCICIYYIYLPTVIIITSSYIASKQKCKVLIRTDLNDVAPAKNSTAFSFSRRHFLLSSFLWNVNK